MCVCASVCRKWGETHPINSKKKKKKKALTILTNPFPFPSRAVRGPWSSGLSGCHGTALWMGCSKLEILAQGSAREMGSQGVWANAPIPHTQLFPGHSIQLVRDHIGLRGGLPLPSTMLWVGLW